MTDTERIICRCVSGTETRSAESSLDNCTCCKEISQDTISCKFHIDWCTCRVNAECKGICTDTCSAEDVCCCTDILKSAGVQRWSGESICPAFPLLQSGEGTYLTREDYRPERCGIQGRRHNIREDTGEEDQASQYQYHHWFTNQCRQL